MMKKSIIVLTLLFLNTSFTCFAGRGGEAFGGSFAGSLLGTTLATAATRPRTVTVKEVSSGGVKYSDLRDVEGRVRDDVARDLRQMQVNVDDIIRSLRDEIRRISDDLAELRKKLAEMLEEIKRLKEDHKRLKLGHESLKEGHEALKKSYE
jgi:chromosome segregation ATPase